MYNGSQQKVWLMVKLIWLQKLWLDLHLLLKVVGADLAVEGELGTDLAAVESTVRTAA